MGAMRTVPATEFKAHCLSLLESVAETGETIVVTKRGRPVAQLRPLEPAPSLVGTVEFLVDDDELVEPLYPDWEPSFP